MATFDLFSFLPGTTLAGILSDPSVQSYVGTAPGPGSQLYFVGGTPDPLRVRSDGHPPLDVQLIVTTAVPDHWTLEFNVRFDYLPDSFAHLIKDHVFFGTTTPVGPCAGIFVSKQGIAYVGGVHHAAGDLVLDSTLQVIPGSFAWVPTGQYLTFRLAADGTTGALYLYVTKTAELAHGQVLRAILPVIPGSALVVAPSDRTLLSARSAAPTAPADSLVRVDSFELASTVIIPNLAPVAEAGADQAARFCSIVKLDGS